MTKNVVVAGSVVLDIVMMMDPERKTDPNAFFRQGKITNIDGVMMYLGGVIGNTGLALKKMGIPVKLITKVGNDRTGNIVKSIIRDFNVNAEIITTDAHNTSAAIAVTPPGMDKITFLHIGAGQSFTIDDMPIKSLHQADLFHFGYPTAMKYLYKNNGDDLIRLFSEAKKTGVTTSVDMTLPDMKSESGKLNWNGIIQRLLPFVDIYMPSIEETLFMLNRDEYIEIAEKAGNNNIVDYIDPNKVIEIGDTLLSMGAKIVVIKMGKKGLYLRTAKESLFSTFGRALPQNMNDWTDRELWCEAIDTSPILSTTGAGDTAIAGILAALIYGYPPDIALEMGTYAANLCIGSPDTVSRIENIKKMEEMLSKDWDRLTAKLDKSIWQLSVNSKVYHSKRDKQ
jgi:sugar/nucleoside kinase (ribokinase family)